MRKFELEKIQFHQRVRRGYLSLGKKDRRRFKVIDTRQGEEGVFQKIKTVIDELIREKGFESSR